MTQKSVDVLIMVAAAIRQKLKGWRVSGSSGNSEQEQVLRAVAEIIDGVTQKSVEQEKKLNGSIHPGDENYVDPRRMTATEVLENQLRHARELWEELEKARKSIGATSEEWAAAWENEFNRRWRAGR